MLWGTREGEAVVTDLPVICGAVKLVPAGFVGGVQPGVSKVAMTCVREPGHPELDADSSMHLCGHFSWPVGPGDDDRPSLSGGEPQ